MQLPLYDHYLYVSKRFLPFSLKCLVCCCVSNEFASFVLGVNSMMPVPNAMGFYNGIGKVSHDKLKDFLKEKEKVCH
jgi:hypothetical protein